MRFNKFFPVIFLLITLLSGCSIKASSNTPKVDHGILDLTGWDIDSNKTVLLDGNWEFYWDRLLSYKDLQKEKPDMYAGVPSTWNEYSIDGKGLPGQGYATYRLHIKTGLPEETMLGLRAHAFSSAYKLYINEKLVAANGTVATKAQEEVGEYKPQAFFFNTPAKEFDIIVQVSNFHHARGGFWYTMHLGSAGDIMDLHDNIIGKEIFLIGALLIIMLFFMAIFIMRRELKYSFYFSCLCILMIIALDMVGQFILLRLFPGIPFNAVIFIWYTSTTWVLFFFILFMHELFKSGFSGIIMRIYLGISLVSQLLFTFTAPGFYTRFADVSDFIETMGVVCTVIIVAIGIKKDYKDGWLNIFSIAVVLVTYIHDILYWTNRITSSFGEIVYAGLFLFIFLQMIIQARRIKLFHEHKTAAELSFLQAQIKPHFLYNTLNSFISISRYDVDKARTLIYDFSNYLRRSFDFKDLSQFVPLKNEIELAKAYVEIEKARFEERIEVTFKIPEEVEVRVPILMLQPLIENAVIHGILPKPEGGKIDISIEMQDRNLIFRIKDNGVGMNTSKLKSIFENRGKKGVGLVNIDRRLRKLYGRGLQIKSDPGDGTEISWRIPVNRREMDDL